MPFPPSSPPNVAVIGGGPAGLMAAEVLAAAGASVDLFDAMPSVGRKFLLAGKGGLNLTHSEGFGEFVGRYAGRRADVEPMLQQFGAAQVRAWAQALGVATFVGSSGRVFPVDMKAAPLLRAWLHRLRVAGVRFHMRHRWLGWGLGESERQALRFEAPSGERVQSFDAVVLALGGGSWARLGSDGAWVPLLAQRGVGVASLQPSNCGFDAGRSLPDGCLTSGWTEHFRSRFAGQPLKTVALSIRTPDGAVFEQAGEFVVTEGGVEGSLVYALSALAREQIAADGRALVHIDLLPGRSAEFVQAEVARARGPRSLATHLKSRLGIDGVKAALLYELLPRELIADANRLAQAIKHLPLPLLAARPLDEAISSAGGVRFEALDDGLMLRAVPGVFCAGEMLDWEAPTGGYLLTACFASGVAAANGVLKHLSKGR
ncbi:MAG: TIGR03862 family flavoprotein [Burkholderiales bacterium]|nr:TIGR03862 family flavoprotein [Burkholderiales bacterium]